MNWDSWRSHGRIFAQWTCLLIWVIRDPFIGRKIKGRCYNNTGTFGRERPTNFKLGTAYSTTTRITDMRGQLLVAVQITTCRGGYIIVAAALQPTGSPAAQLDIIDF